MVGLLNVTLDASSHLGQCDNRGLRKRTKLQLARLIGTSP